MTRILGGFVLIEAQSDGVCALCGAVEETRPYGPDGKNVCFDCMMKDEPAAIKRFNELLDGKVQ